MKFLSIIFFFLLVGCKKESSQISEKYIKNSKGEIYIAIIPEKQGWGTTPSILTQDEVKRINKMLPKIVKQMNIEINFMNRNDSTYTGSDYVKLENYKRQYCPYINELGQKEVFINCFCRTHSYKWKTEIYTVDGGGSCYFMGTINLNTGKSRHFMINSPI